MDAETDPFNAGTDFEIEEIPVNAIVVAAKSRVLRAMLFNGMRESDKNKVVVVRVTAAGKNHPSIRSSYCI